MYTQDLPIRQAVYKFKLEWFKASSKKRFPNEYRYDLGDCVRKNVYELSQLIVVGTELKNLPEKLRFYDMAYAVLATVMDDFNMMNDLNIIDNEHKAGWDVMLVDIKGQLRSLRDSLDAKVNKGQNAHDSSCVEVTL